LSKHCFYNVIKEDSTKQIFLKYFCNDFINNVILRKDLIRKKYSDLRTKLDSEDFHFISDKICNQVIHHIQKSKPKTIHCFLPIESKLELNTLPIINYCLHNGIKVVVPVSDFKTGTLKSAIYNEETALGKGQYDIPEPKNPVWVDQNEIDIVITPLLAFDLKGFRVGYGKGFYDKFFASFNKEVSKIGLSLFDPIPEIENTDKYDIPLNFCITASKTYTF